MRYPLKVLYNPQQEELIMSRQKAHHTKQFKLDAINYRKEHPDLTQVEFAKNLGNRCQCPRSMGSPVSG